MIDNIIPRIGLADTTSDDTSPDVATRMAMARELAPQFDIVWLAGVTPSQLKEVRK